MAAVPTLERENEILATMNMQFMNIQSFISVPVPVPVPVCVSVCVSLSYHLLFLSRSLFSSESFFSFLFFSPILSSLIYNIR